MAGKMTEEEREQWTTTVAQLPEHIRHTELRHLQRLVRLYQKRKVGDQQ